jgi:hypothetical protein
LFSHQELKPSEMFVCEYSLVTIKQYPLTFHLGSLDSLNKQSDETTKSSKVRTFNI